MFLELTYWPTTTTILVNVDRVVSIRADAYSGTMLDIAGAASLHVSEDLETVRAMLRATPSPSSYLPEV